MATSLEKTVLISCKTKEEYFDLCNEEHRPRADIPVLENATISKSRDLLATAFGLRCVDFSSYKSERRHREIASVGRQISAEAPRNVVDAACETNGLVLVADEDLVQCARVLSLATGKGLDLTPPGKLIESAAHLVEQGPLIVVASVSEVTDLLMFTLLDNFQNALRDTRSWRSLPQFTIVTGRDLASLSWVVAKVALSALLPTANPGRKRMATFNGLNGSCVVTEFTKDASHVEFERRIAGTAETIDALAKAAEVVAHVGHGRDACSNTGSDVWFCGRRLSEGSPMAPGRAVLACGLGNPCLRGPYPVKLSSVPAQMMMMASCNSFRMAQSNLTSDFNLGLEFLDGYGRAYVGAVRFQTSGAALQAFMASLASGLTLSEAITVANGYVAQAGIDMCAFVGIGDTHDRAVRTGDTDFLTESRTIDAGIGQEVNLEGSTNGANLISVLFVCDEVVNAAKLSQLTFAAQSPVPGDAINWFYRVECRESATASVCEAESCIRVFFFRFPEPLGTFQVTARNMMETDRKYRQTLESLTNWIELLELGGLSEKDGPLLGELKSCRHAADQFLSPANFFKKFSGLAYGVIENRRREVLAASKKAARQAMQLFSTELMGGWFLSNTFGGTYQFGSSTSRACQYCGAHLIRCIQRHNVREEARILDVCARCGTTLDLPCTSCLSGVQIVGPDEASPGQPFEGLVRVDVGPSFADEDPVECCIRISVPGFSGVAPSNEVTVRELSGPTLEFPFGFRLPGDILPTQCDFKAVVVATDGMAFAHKVLIVR